MKSSRRSFLGMLAGAPFAGAASEAVALVPLPPALPPVAAVTAGNTIISPDVFAREALKLLRENLQIAKVIDQ